jgi:hypothetical protein
MKISSIKFAILALAGLASAAPSSSLFGRATAPPSEDPFYIAPSGYESSAPGTILRSRPVPGALSLFQTIPLNLKGAWQLLYRTTDSMGNPIATVTTVLVPKNADPKKLVSYQVAEDSGGQINCAPSYTLQTGSEAIYAGTGGIEAALIAAALNQGWIVNSPDWEGPKSTFIAGKQAGYATLDSIRAALSSGKTTSVSSDAKVQMWGYSGGALASEWAAELQTRYAPEIPFVGMAVGGLTPNVSNVLTTISGGLFAGIAAAGFIGLGNAYPDFGTYVQDSLIEATKDKFNQGGENCFNNDVLLFAGQDIFKYFKQGQKVLDGKLLPQSMFFPPKDKPPNQKFRHDAMLTSTPPAPIAVNTIRDGATMGRTGTPQMPIFAYKSVNDEISPIADTDKLVRQFCDAGVSVTYIREATGEHFSQAATSTGDVINFLKDRFDGVAQSGCTTQTAFNDLLNPGNAGTLGVNLVNVLLNAVGVPVGPTHF